MEIKDGNNKKTTFVHPSENRAVRSLPKSLVGSPVEWTEEAKGFPADEKSIRTGVFLGWGTLNGGQTVGLVQDSQTCVIQQLLPRRITFAIFH